MKYVKINTYVEVGIDKIYDTNAEKRYHGI